MARGCDRGSNGGAVVVRIGSGVSGEVCFATARGCPKFAALGVFLVCQKKKKIVHDIGMGPAKFFFCLKTLKNSLWGQLLYFRAFVGKALSEYTLSWKDLT